MIEVCDEVGYDTIKEKCFVKQTTFNPHLLPSTDVDEYRLLFKSMQSAKKLPGTERKFVLGEYKEMLGLPYSNILFVLDLAASHFDTSLEGEKYLLPSLSLIVCMFQVSDCGIIRRGYYLL